MGRLLEFIFQFRVFILFILLEGFCIYLITSQNNFQKVKISRFFHSLKGNVFENFTLLNDYTSLKETNYQLARDNVNLLEQLNKANQLLESVNMTDTILNTGYVYTASRVIKSSLKHPFNYLMIDKGSNQGIKRGSAVVSANGIVGVVYEVSEHYASILPIINGKFTCLISLKNYTISGSTSWNGQDYRYVYVDDLPLHVNVAVGDTIFTNNNSHIFPNGIRIGKVVDVTKNKMDKFFRLKVALETDFSKLKYVFVLKNKRKEEWKLLETVEDE